MECGSVIETGDDGVAVDLAAGCGQVDLVSKICLNVIIVDIVVAAVVVVVFKLDAFMASEKHLIARGIRVVLNVLIVALAIFYTLLLCVSS